MKLFSALWKSTPFYAIYDFFRSSVEYWKASKYVSKTFYSDAFKTVIKKYLKVNLKEDWIGRLYGVVNPNVVDGKYDISSMIIEIDGDNTNNEEQVKHWAYKQMELIATLFKIEKLYDYISMEFKHVGPIEHDNYLIVFDIISRKQFAKSAKKLALSLVVYGVATIGILMMLLNWHPFVF